jgi:hypothetical protein
MMHLARVKPRNEAVDPAVLRTLGWTVDRVLRVSRLVISPSREEADQINQVFDLLALAGLFDRAAAMVEPVGKMTPSLKIWMRGWIAIMRAQELEDQSERQRIVGPVIGLTKTAAEQMRRSQQRQESTVLLNLALLNILNHSFGEAETTLGEVLDPRFAGIRKMHDFARYNLALLDLERGDKNTAREKFRKFFETTDSRNFQFYSEYAQLAREKMGDAEEAQWAMAEFFRKAGRNMARTDFDKDLKLDLERSRSPIRRRWLRGVLASVGDADRPQVVRVIKSVRPSFVDPVVFEMFPEAKAA